MKQITSWAILRCKFKDQNAEPFPLAFYENLFTAKGAGTLNMTDYFSDVSHGQLDTTGSAVFGWFTLDLNLADYHRDTVDLVALGKAAAVAAGVKLASFYGVVICMNVLCDLYGELGGQAAVCDPGSMEPTVLGQEMGHGYGLDHSRLEGSADDYKDRWDTMSTWTDCYYAKHKAYTNVGPGLNAANMDSQGWLDTARLWQSGATGGSTVVLRPLYRRDLPGFLAARLGGYYIELREKKRWDAAIPRPAVLVHTFDGFRSYLVPAKSGHQDFRKGDVLEVGDARNIFEEHVRIEVTDLDVKGESATLNVVLRPAFSPPVVGPGTVFGGVSVDGGGWVFLNGHIRRIPPRSPELVLVEQALALRAAAEFSAPVRVRMVREIQQNLRAITGVAGARPETPPPPVRQRR